MIFIVHIQTGGTSNFACSQEVFAEVAVIQRQEKVAKLVCPHQFSFKLSFARKCKFSDVNRAVRVMLRRRTNHDKSKT